MKKIALLLILSSIFLYSATSIEEKKKKLSAFSEQKDNLRVKLKDVASKIFLENKKIKVLKIKIDNLKKDIESQKKLEDEKKKELEEYEKNIKLITESQKLLEQNINLIIAKQFSLSLIKKNSKASDVNSLIKSNVLVKLQDILQNDFAMLKKRFVENKTSLDNYKNEQDKITDHIKKLQMEKDNLTSLNENYKDSIGVLKDEKTKYKNEILKISKEQAILRQTLSKLKILKTNAEDDSKDDHYVNLNAVKVRKLGTSFKKARVKKYRGAKTISPIENYEIIKKFGIYDDPLYKIKIFNETVILRAAKEDSLVRSVLPGKVVFAQDTKVLGKIVIVECKNQMNIIYGHLSQIPSSIKVGGVVKKGSVIGRIKQDLTFGVTQQNRHIDPLDLIS